MANRIAPGRRVDAAAHRAMKRRVEVLGHRMAYVETGQGDPIVFLHGNPTSSFLWRNIIPWLAPHGRCIAPDLIGCGDSDKLPDSDGPERYTVAEHGRFLDALLDRLEIGERVVLVLHDWGSALGFDWARRNAGRVAGIAYMESIVKPIEADDLNEEQRAELAFIEQLRGPTGERMVLEQNLFVEYFLPSMIQRKLNADEMDEYRRPFAEPGEPRRPTLTFPRQIPVCGEPADVVAMVTRYSQWMASNEIPKLLVRAEPGRAIAGPIYQHCRNWPAQREVVVPGLHFLQEDSPDEIGRHVAEWYTGVVPGINR